jgi:hypothetical protein
MIACVTAGSEGLHLHGSVVLHWLRVAALSGLVAASGWTCCQRWLATPTVSNMLSTGQRHQDDGAAQLLPTEHRATFQALCGMYVSADEVGCCRHDWKCMPLHRDEAMQLYTCAGQHVASD